MEVHWWINQKHCLWFQLVLQQLTLMAQQYIQLLTYR